MSWNPFSRSTVVPDFLLYTASLKMPGFQARFRLILTRNPRSSRRNSVPASPIAQIARFLPFERLLNHPKAILDHLRNSFGCHASRSCRATRCGYGIDIGQPRQAMTLDVPKEASMESKHKFSDVVEKKPSGPEVDYSPKKHSLRDQIIFCIKLIGIAAIVFLVFWLMEG